MKIYAMTLLAAAGLLAGCKNDVETASKQFNELPPEVQKTVRAQAPNADIAEVNKITTNGTDAFEVRFLSAQQQNPLRVVVSTNGTLLSSTLNPTARAGERPLSPTGATGTPYSALPLEVQKAIQAHAPNAQIADISRHEENGRVIYEVEFKDQGKNPTMRIASDGTIVQGLQK